MSFLGEDKNYAIVNVRWSNPYTSPPGGASKIRWGLCTPWPTKHRDEIMALAHEKKGAAGPGYSVFITFGKLNLIKRWTPERIASTRMRLMKQRIEKSDPLFAEQFIQEQLDRKPDYYDPEKIALEIKNRVRREIEIEANELQKWLTVKEPV